MFCGYAYLFSLLHLRTVDIPTYNCLCLSSLLYSLSIYGRACVTVYTHLYTKHAYIVNACVRPVYVIINEHHTHVVKILTYSLQANLSFLTVLHLFQLRFTGLIVHTIVLICTHACTHIYIHIHIRSTYA